ncbi:hypothetical protein D047_2417B, partial [Vibrio parahaemolyticus VPTS-2010_2]
SRWSNESESQFGHQTTAFEPSLVLVVENRLSSSFLTALQPNPHHFWLGKHKSTLLSP